jgi:hypothetical protein
MGDRQYTPDANDFVADGAAAMTVSGVSQVGGADAIWDTGGNQGTVPLQQARAEAALVIYVSAIDTTTGDEEYIIIVQGSNDPAFGEDNVQNLAAMDFGGETGRLGDGKTLTTPQPLGSGNYPAGQQYELFFTTEQNNVKYQYVRAFVQISGTTPSITFNAFISLLPIA